MTGKRVLAAQVFDGISDGVVTLASGEQLVLSEEGWLSLVKFTFTHLDGAAPQSVKHMGSDGGPIRTVTEVVIGGSAAPREQATGTVLDEPST